MKGWVYAEKERGTGQVLAARTHALWWCSSISQLGWSLAMRGSTLRTPCMIFSPSRVRYSIQIQSLQSTSSKPSQLTSGSQPIMPYDKQGWSVTIATPRLSFSILHVRPTKVDRSVTNSISESTVGDVCLFVDFDCDINVFAAC